MDLSIADIVFLRFIPHDIYLLAKFSFIGFSVLAIMAIILLIPRVSWTQFRIKDEFAAYSKYNPGTTKKITKSWLKIMSRLNANLESEFKLALIEADDVLDKALKAQGFQGETMGDRLKQITPDILVNVEEIKEAHKIRNDIVHDPDYHLTRVVVQKALDCYEETLRNFNLL
jgi:hypothetical protein